jgi:coenzyme F420-reducing hydrogenase delta subunit
MAETETRVVIFTCNWNAHESLQEAGKQHLAVPPGVRTLKVDCLGQIGAGVILRAFEKGADGVMLVGCPPEECHYEFGSRRAAELFEDVRKLAVLLGFQEDRLRFRQVHIGEGTALIESVWDFVAQVTNSRSLSTKLETDIVGEPDEQ